MIDFNLKVFIAVAKMNSFTRAAEFLNLSQPAVTHQIKNLENTFKNRGHRFRGNDFFATFVSRFFFNLNQLNDWLKKN